jgi:hypothetical protein
MTEHPKATKEDRARAEMRKAYLAICKKHPTTEHADGTVGTEEEGFLVGAAYTKAWQRIAANYRLSFRDGSRLSAEATTSEPTRLHVCARDRFRCRASAADQTRHRCEGVVGMARARCGDTDSFFRGSTGLGYRQFYTVIDTLLSDHGLPTPNALLAETI